MWLLLIWHRQAPHQASCCGVTVYPKKYVHGFVVLCFVVVMQCFIMNSHEVFIHIHQGCFAGTGTIDCQWSKPDGYGKISQCITTTKHSKAKIVCIFRGIYYMCQVLYVSFWISVYAGRFSAEVFNIITVALSFNITFVIYHIQIQCCWCVIKANK